MNCEIPVVPSHKKTLCIRILTCHLNHSTQCLFGKKEHHIAIIPFEPSLRSLQARQYCNNVTVVQFLVRLPFLAGEG